MEKIDHRRVGKRDLIWLVSEVIMEEGGVELDFPGWIGKAMEHILQKGEATNRDRGRSEGDTFG